MAKLVGPALVQLGELLARLPQMGFHGLVVRGIGKFSQVALPVQEPAPGLAQVGPCKTTVAPLSCRLGIEHQEPVDDADDAIPRLTLPVDALEVGEHAGKEPPPQYGSVVLRFERHVAPE